MSEPEPRPFLSAMPRRLSRPMARGKGVVVVERPPIGDEPAPLLAVMARLATRDVAGVRFLVPTLVDWLLGRDDVVRRAVRLRRTLESMGASAIKFGQQLSMRIDLLPVEFCEELGRLLDGIEPFEFAYAARRIEAVTGRPLAETFSAIDPAPLGSASIACVYQALLADGTRVVVKVRRPNVVERFNADLTALGWCLDLLEWLSVVRPGRVHHLKSELRGMFMEEMDFDRERRYQALFRRATRKAGLDFVTAPRVHDELSGPDVLVSDYAEGLALGDVLGAKESGDPAALARLAELEIDPETVGRRLINVSLWSVFESDFFHADPHPANLFVQPGGKLVLVDFGACGSTSTRSRRSQYRFHHAMIAGDAQGMTEALLDMIKPLPPVDLAALTRRIRATCQHRVVVAQDEAAAWWERTSVALWLEFLEHARRFQLPIQRDTVRMVRSSLLYDTLASRLAEDLSTKDLRRFFARAHRRRRRAMRRKYEKKSTYRDLFLRVQETGTTLDRILARAEMGALEPPVQFATLYSKATRILRVVAQMTLFAAVLAAVLWVRRFLPSTPTIHGVLTPVLAIAFLLAVVVGLRKIVFQLREVSPRRLR